MKTWKLPRNMTFHPHNLPNMTNYDPKSCLRKKFRMNYAPELFIHLPNIFKKAPKCPTQNFAIPKAFEL